MKAYKLLEMAASAMEAAMPPNSFGGNAMLRKLGQVMRLARDTGLGQVEVEMPKPEKKAPRKSRGGTSRSRVVTKK